MKRIIEVFGAVLVTGAFASGVALAASSPAVVSGGHGTIAQTSAMVDGTVNPDGSATTYYFRWGPSPAYVANSSPRSAGSGSKPVAVRATAAGLTPGTTYHYQLVATNRYGTATGADRTLMTAGHPPAVVATGAGTQIGATYATLTGAINPENEQTTWQFQYGLSSAYGSSTFGGTLSAGSTPLTVSSPLQGLTPGTIFHYRLVAEHGSIVSAGGDQIFMTYPSARPVAHVRATTIPHRARRKPFLFTTSGRVVGPSWIPGAFACSGTVTIKSFFAARRVRYSAAAVQPDCTFAAQTAFARKPGRGPKNRQVRLNVFIRFLGNGYLAPTTPRRETIVLG